MDDTGERLPGADRPTSDRVATSSATSPVSADGGPRTRGFLFCDLRDYTAFVETHGDRAAAELLERYRALVRAATARAAGAEIRTEGDGFYVVFPSASAGVRCGLDIIGAATEASLQTPDQPIRVGVGIHAGESVEDAEGYVGSAVNIAARVGSIAEPGELLVTDTVRGLVRTSLDVAFTPRGRPKLKGIAEPIALYRVTEGTLVGGGRPVARGRAAFPGLLVGAAAVAILGALVVARQWSGGVDGNSPSPSRGSAGIPSGSRGGAIATAGLDTSPSTVALPGRLAFIATQNRGPTEDAGSQLYVADASGGPWQRMTELTDRVAFAAWSADGRRLVYELASGDPGPPHVVEIGSAPASSLLPWPTADGTLEWEGRSYLSLPLAWSTSGEVFTCGYAADPTTARIFAVATDGSAARLVTRPDPAIQSERDEDCQPAVASDGHAIAFMSGASAPAMQSIWLAPADGLGERARVTAGMWIETQRGIGVSWSPDGERLAFAGQEEKGGPIEIWTIEARGTDLHRLTNDDVTDFSPAWSPDGRWIAWIRVVGGQQQIWVMAADGGVGRPLIVGAEGDQLDLIGWAPDPG